MPNRRSLLVVAVLALAAGAALSFGFWLRSARPEAEPPRAGLECGHWAVLRSCELLGVPVSPTALAEMMPAGPAGHSLQDIAETLHRAGLVAEGSQEDLKTFLSGEGVRIVHLTDPDHFIVVTKAGFKSVVFLDHEGRRRIVPTAQIAKRWTGYILRVERPVGGIVGFEPPPKPGQPRIAFDTLFIDKGDIALSAGMKSVRFEFPFRNAGSAPLTIKKVHPGCSCLKASQPEKPIPPGGTGVVALDYRFDPKKRVFVHDTAVETDDPVFPILPLRAAGNTNVLVTVSPVSLNLGDLPLGAEKRAFLFVQHSGEEDFDLRTATASRVAIVVHSEASQELAERVSLGARMPALSPHVRILEIRIVADMIGRLADEIVMETNIERFGTIRVPVQGRVVPPVSASPSFIAFGETAPSASLKRSLTLIHHNGDAFRVLAVKPETPGLSWSMEGNEIRLVATGTGALSLDGKSLSVEVATEGQRFVVEIPVFAARKPGS